MKNCKTPEETNVLKYKAITPDKYPINNPTWKNIQEAISRGNGGDWSDAMKYRDQFRKCTGGMIDLKSITNPPKKTQQSIRDIPQG